MPEMPNFPPAAVPEPEPPPTDWTPEGSRCLDCGQPRIQSVTFQAAYCPECMVRERDAATAPPASLGRLDLEPIKARRRYNKVLGGNWEQLSIRKLYEDFDALIAEIERLRASSPSSHQET